MPCGGILVNRVPADRFTTGEAAALGKLFETQPMFGADGLQRIAQSRREVERVRAASPLPVTELPDLDETGAALIDRLAAALQ